MEECLSLQMIKSVQERYKGGMMLWHYEHGLVLYAALKTSELYPKEKSNLLQWIQSLYSPLIRDDGYISTCSLGEHNLDQINPGRCLFSLFDETGDIRYLSAINLLMRQVRTQPRCKNGVFWHKEIYPWQIWLDGLYMVQPFRAQWALRTGYHKEFDDIIYQLTTVYNSLRDDETGLLYHGYDESKGQRWSDPDTGLSPHFWSRAIGWYAMSIIDIYEIAQSQKEISSKKGFSEIVKAFQVLCGSILNNRTRSGMWYQVINLPDEKENYLETSASSMFAYCFLKGHRLGLLSSEYKEAGLLALNDIQQRFLTMDKNNMLHLGSICTVAGLGGNPYRDGSLKYYFNEPTAQDDFKGVGPFILACLEKEILST